MYTACTFVTCQLGNYLWFLCVTRFYNAMQRRAISLRQPSFLFRLNKSNISLTKYNPQETISIPTTDRAENMEFLYFDVHALVNLLSKIGMSVTLIT